MCKFTKADAVFTDLYCYVRAIVSRVCGPERTGIDHGDAIAIAWQTFRDNPQKDKQGLRRSTLLACKRVLRGDRFVGRSHCHGDALDQRPQALPPMLAHQLKAQNKTVGERKRLYRLMAKLPAHLRMVAHALASGLEVSQLAGALGINKRTAQRHVAAIRAALQ